MKKLSLILVMAIASLCIAQAVAQTAPQMKDQSKTLAQVLDSGVMAIESDFIPAAEAMPEDKYGFAPSNGAFKGVRTFAQEVKHVAAVNYMMGAAILGEKSPVDVGSENGPEGMKTKAEIVKFAKDSFAYAHKAVASITADNATADIASPFGDGKTTRAGLAAIFAWHGFDHYGQMVEYLRMNGIIPPASRK